MLIKTNFLQGSLKRISPVPDARIWLGSFIAYLDKLKDDPAMFEVREVDRDASFVHRFLSE